MGKIILEFDSTEEFIEAQTAVNAGKLMSIIWDFDQKLRNMSKYGDQDCIQIDVCRDELRATMLENGLTFGHEIFN